MPKKGYITVVSNEPVINDRIESLHGLPNVECLDRKRSYVEPDVCMPFMDQMLD